MQCTKCKEVLNLSEFSYKNIKEKIYYLYCNDCRKKSIESQKKYKERMKEDYNIVKDNNIIECACGTSYIAFRDYHIKRHENTNKHIKALLKN